MSDLILNQFVAISPLFIIISLGFLGGKFLKVKDTKSFSVFVLYVFTPIIVFNAIVKSEINQNFLILPILFFLLSSAICLLNFYVGGFFWSEDDKTKNIVSYASGSANVAFFGIPVVLLLYGDSAIPTISLVIIGFVVYDSTLGYLIATNSRFKLKEVAKKLAYFPPFIGICVGLLVKVLGVNLGFDTSVYKYVVSSSSTTMATLGIMLIGLSIANFKFKIDLKYNLFVIINKLLLWPLIILGLVVVFKALDLNTFAGIEEILMIVATVPVATNSVILATQFNSHPDKASVGVFVTAIISLISIPVWNAIVQSLI